MSFNPLYIQEISPINLRGAFASLNQLSFASGVLLGMVRINVCFQFTYNYFKMYFSSVRSLVFYKIIMLNVSDNEPGDSFGDRELLDFYVVSFPYTGTSSIFDSSFLP